MPLKNKAYDFLVIGAGIIGLNIALSLKKRFPDCHIGVMEKEREPGLHASGRNSGVLHAGFYYTSDTMKARFCKNGNQRLTDYCIDRGLPINRCGKLVVANSESELDGLQELYKRGKANGVELAEITEDEAREIQPGIKTCQKALFSPTTSTVSPTAVVNAVVSDVVEAGIDILVGTSFISCHEKVVRTSQGSIEAAYVVNAAGLYADRIAMAYGFSRDYRILPFKGIYLYLNEKTPNIRTNIYPLPNLKHPFLGVHFTTDVEGHIKLGPTAIPALWREQYGGLENFDFTEMVEILMRDLGLFCQNDFGFRQVAIDEIRKQSPSRLINLAKYMIDGLGNDTIGHWGRPGIRAQLVNIRKRRLEMDFKFEGDDRSFHILNAVSPAFTCSIPFSEYLVDNIVERVR